MPAANPFIVPIGDLVSAPGSVRTHRFATPVEWSVDLSYVVPESDIEADLELVSTSGGLLVRGVVSADTMQTCSRCLTEAVVPVHVEVAQMVEDGVDDDDEYHTSGDMLDLEPILRDEVLLAMPLRPRCEPECEQLVPNSESDLNTSAPGSAGRSDSPFAALQDLLGSGD